jgi:hypothetical protein
MSESHDNDRQIETAPTDPQIEELAHLMRENVALCSSYLAEFDGDYRILIS